jgi:hypothetical protein
MGSWHSTLGRIDDKELCRETPAMLIRDDCTPGTSSAVTSNQHGTLFHVPAMFSPAYRGLPLLLYRDQAKYCIRKRIHLAVP